MSQNSKNPDRETKSKGSYPLRGRIGLAIAWLFWVITAFFIGALLAQGLWWLLDIVGLPVSAMNESVESAVMAALLYVASLVVAIAVPRALKKISVTQDLLGLHRPLSWSDIGLGAVGIIPYLLISAVLTNVAVAIIPGFDLQQAQDVGFSGVGDRLGVSLAFVTLVIIAPLAEEMLFRGVLFGELRKLVGFVGATFFVSLGFALLHGQLNVGIDVFALSIILCSLREVTGSIWAGVILHMTKNGIAFFFLFVQPML